MSIYSIPKQFQKLGEMTTIDYLLINGWNEEISFLYIEMHRLVTRKNLFFKIAKSDSFRKNSTFKLIRQQISCKNI